MAEIGASRENYPCVKSCVLDWLAGRLGEQLDDLLAGQAFGMSRHDVEAGSVAGTLPERVAGDPGEQGFGLGRQLGRLGSLRLHDGLLWRFGGLIFGRFD